MTVLRIGPSWCAGAGQGWQLHRGARGWPDLRRCRADPLEGGVELRLAQRPDCADLGEGPVLAEAAAGGEERGGVQ
jgi:hypothetical protein